MDYFRNYLNDDNRLYLFVLGKRRTVIDYESLKNFGAKVYQAQTAQEFCEEVFAEGQEILILVTELTISYYGAHFISRYGCKEYFNHNKELLFYERQKEIIQELENLDLED